jgi:hypothetical protein
MYKTPVMSVTCWRKGGFIMRNVLAVITALMIAAVVLAPSMGYTISSAGKVNYTINSGKASYSIGSGTPAHEMAYNEEKAGEYLPTYSIVSTAVPYSDKLGTSTKYSVKLMTDAKDIEVLGAAAKYSPKTGVTMNPTAAVGTPKVLGKGLVLPGEVENKNEQATGLSVIPNATSGNATGNVTGNATGNATAPMGNTTIAPATK